MRGLVVPEKTEDFTADPVELFFDLAFVFAFSQLVGVLIHDHDWEGVGRVALLFLLIWLPWTQFTWSANAVSGNQRIVRVAFLVATAASVPMAAAVETAFESSGALFAIPIAVIYLMAIGVMILGIETGTEEWRSSVRYLVPNAIAMVLLVVGGFLDDEFRVAAWIASIIVVVYATLRAGQGEWIVRSGHFAERHGLIIIVALGEVIVALGTAVVDPLSDGEGFDGSAVVALIATGTAAGLLWWSYFDRVQPAFEHRADDLQGRERAMYARDVYTYCHLFVVIGIIFIAAALEDATLHASDPLPLSFRMMLLGGLALFVVGVGTGVWRSFRVVAKERLVALAVLGAFLAVASEIDGVVIILVLDAVILLSLIAEHLRIEVRSAA